MLTGSTLQESRRSRDATSDFAPVLLQEIELSQPLPVLSAFDQHRRQSYERTRCLIRLHKQPLGLVDFPLPTDELLPDQYVPRIWQALGEQINAHLREDGLPEVTGLSAAGLPGSQTPRCVQERQAFLQTAPFASVVLSTRDRPDCLARCLLSLLALDYPRYEVIVVDNAPATTATVDLIEQTYANEPKVRYVREDRPGLSAGRNRGILEARGDIIAITDDDVVVDPFWLLGLARGFSITENVACVTGLLLPLELETPAQLLLETYCGFTKGFARRIFDLREHRWNKPAYPYIVGACGTGASMAFTAHFLLKEGGFDPALGAGSPTYGSEDLAMLFRVIVNGKRVVYEPAALLYHQHHRDQSALQKQFYGYGVGFTAYLTKIIIDHPWLILDAMNKFVRSLFFLARIGSPKPEAIAFPEELKRLERKGWLVGPLAYIESRLACGWTRKGLALASANVTRIKAVDSSDISRDSLVERISK